MAELTTMRNNVLGYPIYGMPYVVAFPILDEDGDPVTGLTPDSEVSLNGDTGADTATEAAEIAFTTATNKGMYQLQLSAAEMTANVVTITVYTGATTSQATPIVLYPKQLPMIASGVAGATGDDTTHIHLDGKSAINDFYNGCIVFLKDHTGANQVRMITDYVGATCLATVAPAFATAPDNTTDYEVYMTDVAITTLIANNILQIAGTAQTAGDLAGAIITDAAGTNIAADIIALKAETVTILADTNELQAEWVNGGRLDLILDIAALAPTAAVVADAVWNEVRADHVTVGTFGEVATTADIVDAIWNEAAADHVAAGSLGKSVADILADTAELQTDWHDGGRLDLIADAILLDTGTTLDGRIPAALVGGRMDASVGAMAAAVLTAAAIATGAIDADALAADAVDEILDEVVEGSITLRQAIRLLLAVLTGKSSGGGTPILIFRDTGDSADRITATVDANGNRTAVTRVVT